MEILDLIRVADSAQQIMGLLAIYAATLREAAAFPEWWLQLPLDNPLDAQRRMVELLGLVNLASRQLDERRCGAAKRALQVFAAAVWKLEDRLASRRQGRKSAGAAPPTGG